MGILGWIEINNPGHIAVRLSQEKAIDISVAGLILFSIAFGGLFVISAAGVRETRNLFLNWKYSRQQKKDSKIQEMYTEAVNTYLAKRVQEAIPLFNKILVLKPNHVDSLLWLGNAYRLEKNLNEAIRLHRKGKYVDDHNREIIFALAKDYEDAGRYEEAINVLKESHFFAENEYNPLSKTRDLLMLTGKWEEAHDLQEKLLKQNPKGAASVKEAETLLYGLKYEVGRYFFEAGNMDQAKAYFKSAFKADKNFLPAYIGLGEVLIHENKMEEAGEFWEKAFFLNSNYILLFRIEDLYLEMGQPSRAISFYQNVMRREPNNIVNRFYLGKLYYRLEMIDDAYNLLSGLEDYEGRFPDLHKLLGLVHLRRGNPMKAVTSFKRALHLKEVVRVPYYCPACDYHTHEWSGRCHRCGRWNSYTASPILEEAVLTRFPLSEIRT